MIKSRFNCTSIFFHSNSTSSSFASTSSSTPFIPSTFKSFSTSSNILALDRSYRPRGTETSTEDDPRLPTSPRIPINIASQTINTISTELLMALRLALMSQFARQPTIKELEYALPGFLKKEKSKEETKIKNAFKKVKVMTTMHDKLKVARKWANDMEEHAGILSREERDKLDYDRKEVDRIHWRKRGGTMEEFEKVKYEEAVQTQQMQDAIERSRQYKAYKITSVGSERRLLPRPPPILTTSPSTTSATPPSTSTSTEPLPAWRIQKDALKAKFPKGWSPPKRISTEAISLIRLLQQSNPVQYTTEVLGDRFKISPEAVRRILKSQFELSPEEKERRERKRLNERIEEGGGQTWGGNLVKQREEMKEIREKYGRGGSESRYSSFKGNESSGNTNFTPSIPSESSISTSSPISSTISSPTSSSSSSAPSDSSSQTTSSPPSTYSNRSSSSSSSYSRSDSTSSNDDFRRKTNVRRDTDNGRRSSRSSSGAGGSSASKQVSW